MSDDKKSLLDNLSGLITLLSGIFGIISTVISIFSSNDNKYQATLFLSIGYFAFMVFLISLFSKKKISSGILVNNKSTEKWEFKYSPIYRVSSIIGMLLITFNFSYFLLSNIFVFDFIKGKQNTSQPIVIFPTLDNASGSGTSNDTGQSFFAQEKLYINPCTIGKAKGEQDEKWEVLTKGEDGIADIEALFMTTESIIIDEINLVITQTDSASDINGMTFYDNPYCEPFGGGPVTEINFEKVYINRTTISYPLIPKSGKWSVTLPYQLDENEGLKVNILFSPTESGIYHISIVAKIVSYSGEAQTIESNALVYKTLVLSESEFQNIQIIKETNP